MWWEKLEKEILSTDLYARSGTEVGLSEDTLKLEEKDGDYHVVKTSEDDIPEVCYTANSDRYINYPELNEFVFGKKPDSWLIGNYKKLYVGQILDPKIRENASSGGLISGIQTYLLRKKKIDGAVTLRMRKDVPYLGEPIVATSEAEILEGAQSKYSIAPVNQILAELPGKYTSLSYTGLPEQIASVRKLQKMNHPNVSNIEYVLGIFYGNILSSNSIKSFLRSRGHKNIKDITSLNYRAGEWPGNLEIKLKGGDIVSAPKFHANYLIPSHITPYSLLQVDYMSELADISGGDAWAPVYERRGEGWSTIIARTEKGQKLLEQMEKDGALYLKEISEAELIQMHSHGLDFKKRGSFIRIAARKKKGLPVPEYGYEPTNIPSGRVRFEKILDILFSIFQWRLTIWVLERIPHKLIGWAFVKARNVWKGKTKSSKKSNLADLQFRLTTHAK